MTEEEMSLEDLAKKELNYPDKWDTAAYPTVWDALWEAYWWLKWFKERKLKPQWKKVIKE